ncbi:MAG: chemotaxis protein CheA [Pseudomonadota bacterium]
MDDDDDFDFQALFFEECNELLGTLQEHLNQLADGTGDEETVHAAFRAVHSVKGGAAAFGFDQLISFAHIFETVMDLIRSDQLDPTDEINQILLRSGDMMEVLIEAAQTGTSIDEERISVLREELEDLAKNGGASEGDDAPSDEAADPEAPQADNGGLELFSDASDDTAGTPDAKHGAHEATEEDANTPVPTQEIAVRFLPEQEFFSSGHDPLRLIRSARSLGLTSVEVQGQVPTLDSFDPNNCPLGWELVFDTDKGEEELDAFFEIYSHIATIEFIGGEQDVDEAELSSVQDANGSAGAGDDAAQAAPSSAPEDAKKPAAAPSGGAPSADGAARTATAPPAAGDQPAKRSAGSTKSLRVELSRIDRLVNLVGEMLITQAGIAQKLMEIQSQAGEDGMEMGHNVDAMSRQLRELQESVMAIRAQPVKSVFSRMPRVVRDLADKLGKEARLTLEGEHTEVDATVIEELAEPLTHMLRNSMDHGLEPNSEAREQVGKPRVGNIKLAAEHRGERVIITIEDDGRGVNRERVHKKAIEQGLVSAEDSLAPEEVDMLIFHPGFSTAEQVSSVSGRGVGMDVVKKKIVSLGGRVALESNPGKGTRFEITLPLTLAVMDGMTIVVGDQKFILPLSSVVEALHIDENARKHLPSGDVLLERRGEFLRLIDLRRVLSTPVTEHEVDMAIVVDTETDGLVALIVDELIGQRQIVLKSLEANFRRVEGISGATILGDGQVALILDVPSLLGMSGGGSYSEMMH